MPPLPPAEEVLRLSYRGDYAGHPWAAVLHAKYDGLPPDQAILDGVAQDLFNAWADNFLDVQSTAVTLEQLLVSDLSAANPVNALVVGNNTGAQAGTALPPSIACCVSWAIAARYRGGHPRTYLVGMSETITETVSTFTGIYADAVKAAATGFRNDVNALLTSPGNELALGTVSYYTANNPRVVPVFFPYVGERVGRRIDHQRRRDGREA